MLASLLIFPAVPEISVQRAPHPSVRFVQVITGLSVLVTVSWLVLRRKYLGRSVTLLRSNPENIEAIKRWRTGHILSFTLSEAVALYGVNLRYLGSSFREVIPFYAAGFVLMLWSWPRTVEASRVAS
jgi:hypothetical protein